MNYEPIFKTRLQDKYNLVTCGFYKRIALWFLRVDKGALS